jgi:hypothetical protein
LCIRLVGGTNRADGNVTAEGTFGDDSEPDFKVDAMYRFKDNKLMDCRGDRLTLWLFFSKTLADAAGRPVGYGRGWHFSTDTLKEQFRYDEIPTPKCNLKHPGLAFSKGSATSNPKAMWSHDQKKELSVAKAARRSESNERGNREARRVAAVQDAAFTNDLVECDRCGTSFVSETNRTSHSRRGCSVQKLRSIARRSERRNGSVEKRLEAWDIDDLAEAQQRAASKSDRFEIQLKTVNPGWELRECSPSALTPGGCLPLDCGAFDWVGVGAASRLGRGDRVRVGAHHFGLSARDEFGPSWRSAFFYGKIVRRVGTTQTFDVAYDDEPDTAVQSHCSLIERAVARSGTWPHICLPAAEPVIRVDSNVASICRTDARSRRSTTRTSHGQRGA